VGHLQALDCDYIHEITKKTPEQHFEVTQKEQVQTITL
jgi:hypothetical protein